MNANNVIYFLCYLVILVIGSVVYLMGDHGDAVLWANAHHGPVLNPLFKWITYLGDGYFFAIITLLFLILKRRIGLIMLLMGLAQTVVSFFLKRIVFKGQPRPKTYFENIEQVSLHFVEGVKVHGYHSFPSGHTLTAFALATFLACYFQRPIISLLLLIAACMAGFSRVYLAQHFLIDVCAGSLLGIALGYGFSRWARMGSATELKSP